MASKWKYLVIDEDGVVHGSDNKDDIIKLFEDENAGAAVLEVCEDGVFQLSYNATEEDDDGNEVEPEEPLSRVDIEAL